jgi:hypothetical protein
MEKRIVRFDLMHLRNEAHVEFHETVDSLLAKFPPAQRWTRPSAQCWTG